MDKLGDNVQDQYGNAVYGAAIFVYEEGTTTPVVIYEDDETTPKVNPMTSDGAGRWECKIVAGTYDIVVSFAGQTWSWSGFSTPSVGPTSLTIPVDDSNFDRLLTTGDDTIQKALDAIDDRAVIGASNLATPGRVVVVGAAAGEIDESTVSLTDFVSNAEISTDNALPRFDGVTGKVVQNGPVVCDDNGQLTGVDAITLNPTLVGSAPTVEGAVNWNATYNCLEYQTGVSGVVNQVGQEDHDPYYNDTGLTIANLKPVYRKGTITGTRENVGLADTSATGANVGKRDVAGITTHSAITGSEMLATSRGYVTGDTSAWPAGIELWVGVEELTSTKPLTPDSQIRAGRVITSGTSGLFRVAIQDLSWVGGAQSSAESMERTGFILELDGTAVDSAGTAVSLAIDDTTRTFTMSSTAGSIPVFTQDNLFVLVGDQTVVWTDVEGDHFFYIDVNGTLQHSTVFDRSYVLGPNIFVAYSYWDAANSETILGNVLIETHGLQMDGATHLHFHETIGAQWEFGLTISDLVTDGNGSLDADAQFGVDGGEITDEDLRHPISTIGSTTGLPILYLDGASANTRQVTNPGFSVITDTQFGGITTTDRLVYNEWTGSIWQVTAVSVNDFVLCHVFAAGTSESGGGKRLYAAMGQAVYGNETAARDGATAELATLAGTLPFAELRPVASIIFQTGSYGNAVNARCRPSEIGINPSYVDWRQDNVPSGAAFAPSTHNDLSGRSDPGTHPTLQAPANSDQIVKLSDSGGAQKLSVTDSLDVEVASVDSDGNALFANSAVVGVDPGGTEAMRVSGSIRAADASTTTLILDCTGGSGRDYRINSTTGGALTVYDNDAAATRLTIDSAGSLTLGADEIKRSTDVNTLHLVGGTDSTTAQASIFIVGKTSAANPNDIFLYGDEFKFLPSTSGSGAVVIGTDTGGSETLRIDTDMRLGGAASVEFKMKSTGGNEWDLGTNSSSWFIYDITNATNRFRILNNGTMECLGVYTQTTASAANVNVDSSGNLKRSTSSARYKEDIAYNVDAAAFDAINSATFTSKIDGKSYMGFIAEDVAAADPRLAQYDPEEKPDALETTALVAVLWAKVKQLEARIEELEA